MATRPAAAHGGPHTPRPTSSGGLAGHAPHSSALKSGGGEGRMAARSRLSRVSTTKPETDADMTDDHDNGKEDPGGGHDGHGGGEGGGVRFAGVQIREYERELVSSPSSRAPKLALGWHLKHETFRRLDSLERERAPARTGAYLPLTLAEREAIARAARDGRDLLKDSLDARPTVPEPAAGLSYDAELDNWYLGPEGSVHHAGGVTSRVSAVDGRIVTTAAYGSRYRLLTVRREVEHMLQRIGMAFDPENPLLNASSLVYAWTAHSLEAEMRDAARLLRGVESKLSPFGGSVRECFATVFKAFAALGFPDAEHAAET